MVRNRLARVAALSIMPISAGDRPATQRVKGNNVLPDAGDTKKEVALAMEAKMKPYSSLV